jgi:hypothetical protein
MANSNISLHHLAKKSSLQGRSIDQQSQRAFQQPENRRPRTTTLSLALSKLLLLTDI